MSDAEGPLARENARIHEKLLENLLRVIERLTALDIEAAGQLWSQFCWRMEHHTELEDGRVLPLYRGLPDPPENGKPDQFDGDHRIIEKTIARGTEVLTALDPEDAELRRAMVLALGPFIRLLGVLEHHTVREQKYLYPRLDEALTSEECDELAFVLGG
jgi:hypothetical protein